MAAALSKTTLPNGMQVFCVQKYEVPLVYQQVQAYFKHGIEIHAGDTIFDIGANIGLFTMLAQERCGPEGLIYAFEPIPSIFKALELNAQRYGPNNIKTFSYGLSRQNGVMSFTYFPRITVVSTAYPDQWKEELTYLFIHSPNQLPWFARWLRLMPAPLRSMIIRVGMRQFMQSKLVSRPVVTVSHILREYGIKQIDLLKLDVEKSELDILSSIEEQDWPRIKQVVMEIHDQDNRREKIVALLTSQGFSNITIASELGVEISNIVNLYATR